MVRPVTDPALLKQLNGDPSPVTDPELLKQLNSPEGASSSVKGNGQASASPAIPEQPADLEQILGPSDFTKSFASAPFRILKSAMQMVGAGEHVPGIVNELAAEGDKSLPGRIAGDVAGTGGIRAGVGRLAQSLQTLNAAKGVLPAVGRTAEAATYGAAQGAITSPDEQVDAAKMGAAGGAVVPALGGALKLAGRAGAHILGATTGAGTESVRQAFKGGPGLVENMRGHVEPRTVVDNARSGIQTMRKDMLDDYRTGKAAWASDTTPLKFDPIKNAYYDTIAKFSYNGQAHPGIADVQGKVYALVTKWEELGRSNPAFFTTEGLDALKRQLNDIYPNDIQNRTGRAFVSDVVDSVKSTIVKQRPDYAAAMKDYWQRSNQLDEIERSLSLGDRNTVDTALRKLQSLMRNNVNSNFGQRVQSARALEQMGDANILPQVAGQSLNSWTPRGLQGAVGIGGSIVNPSALPLMPLMSPRVVGETARGIGMISNDPRTQAIIEALRRFTPAAARNITRKNSND